MTWDKLSLEYRKRVKKLTGDSWCPYPSLLFILVVMAIRTDTARRIIKQRRGYLAPYFYGQDPQCSRLSKLVKKYKINLVKTYFKVIGMNN